MLTLWLILTIGCAQQQMPATQVPPPVSTQTSTNQPSATSQDETANWKVYRNELYGLEISYPGDWYIPSNRPASTFYIVGFCSTAANSVCKNKARPGYFGDVVLDLIKSPFSQENFSQYCKTNFEQSRNYSNGVIENKGSYSICRLPGLETPFKTVYIFHNGVLFVMSRYPESFSISTVTYPVSEKDFEQILSTFKFAK